ncbi:alternative ribosome rescue aminoacyl-tRNA hydrolase ArfB [Bordetella genomosp. 13]|uniref:alternative ribosome rescue aminoacyl-tRNA hydrolase ArfB n=1 Tax=Bordetella genomosp. 13 TaxID=463040 RepID=UPI00119EDBE9|nr:alternative ribosome rescue aminoacyl-tRNA hydrolase ArfB [Bordetella genomosp. 13]
MLHVSGTLYLDEREIVFTMIRAQGAGGQNVNKVSSAIHLRFDVRASALPDRVKEALLALGDYRITKDGVIVIKAQSHRSQELNRAEAVERLLEMVREGARPVTLRRATRPTLASKRRRIEGKTQRGQVKRLRGRVSDG